MVGVEPALNILLDAVVTLQGTTNGDDGVVGASRTLAGSPITVLCDRVIPRLGRRVVDHGTAQHMVEFNRTEKLVDMLTIETKLQKKGAAPLVALLAGATGVIVKFTITASGFNVTGFGLVEDFDPTVAIPSEFRFSIRSYGEAFTVTAT